MARITAAGTQCIVAISSDSNDIMGYVIVRPAVTDYRVGPLFARGDAIANALLDWVNTTLVAGSIVYIDVPVSESRMAWVQQRGLIQGTFDCMRMYVGGVTPSGYHADVVYGTTSLELG